VAVVTEYLVQLIARQVEEVASIGRFVAQQALASFGKNRLKSLGLAGKERAFITFVETACLLHDVGNPPFGHFGERTVSDWFEVNEKRLAPPSLAGEPKKLWNDNFSDFLNFDGNPQGLRIATRLQAQTSDDLSGLNLTATTLAATLKYPWPAAEVKTEEGRKKPGYFLSEKDIFEWVQRTFDLRPHCRHPLVYLMEAADDIAYCVSDIEDGIDKGLISSEEFAQHMEKGVPDWSALCSGNDNRLEKEAQRIRQALSVLKEPKRQDTGEVKRLRPMNDFRSPVIRLCAYVAGVKFRDEHDEILSGKPVSLIGQHPLLAAMNTFVSKELYNSSVVKNREITAHAVVCGLLDAYRPIMDRDCSRQPRSATMQAELVSVLYELSASAYERIKRENPGLSHALLTYIITVISERLSFANRAIGLLQR
jgi:dGTPase